MLVQLRIHLLSHASPLANHSFVEPNETRLETASRAHYSPWLITGDLRLGFFGFGFLSTLLLLLTDRLTDCIPGILLFRTRIALRDTRPANALTECRAAHVKGRRSKDDRSCLRTAVGAIPQDTSASRRILLVLLSL